MRNRSVLPIFVAGLLLAFGVAAAATTPAAETSPAPAPAMTPVESPGAACAASLSTPLDLPGFAPTPLTVTLTCGTTCSQNPCKGAVYNSTCVVSGIHGFVGKCLSPLGNNCSDGVTFQCQCWTGPLP
jgi:hypothetical protein